MRNILVLLADAGHTLPGRMFEKVVFAIAIHIALVASALAFECTSDRLGQGEMNQCAQQDFDKADALLNSRYKKIIGCLKAEAQPLIESQRAWIKFRDAECKFQGSASEGGSVQPMVVSGCLKLKTEERAKALDYYLTCEEGDLSCPTFHCDFPKPGKPK